MERIIIDTDIGDDIDDAFAIVFGCNSPELKVEGITTVFRNSIARARMTKALMSSYGITDIPVYAGVDTPLVQTYMNRDNDRFDEAGNLIPCQYQKESMDQYSYEEEWAPDFIINKVRENPNEIVLIPIGPLTNIALAIRKAPDIVPLIKKIVLMGGVVHQDVPEWNILCDPEAAYIVYKSGANIQAIGLDVTMQCKLTLDKVKEFEELSSRGSKVLSAMMKSWFEHYKFECPVLHDPLTIGCVIDSSFVGCKEYIVEIGLEGENRGKTIIVPERTKNSAIINVAETVDAERYLKFFQERVFIK